jgi:hypothetical protein
MRHLSAIAGALFAAAPALTPALALDMPTRKAGLWELKLDFVGRNLPGQTMQQCVDAATDKLMNQAFGGTTKEACSRQDVSNAGGVMTIDSVCKFGPATVTTHSTVSGSFDSAYSVDVESSREGGPPVPGGSRNHTRIAAKWLGPCASGQKPGDIIMANGMKMNVLEMAPPAAPRR